jgi:cobalt-precorrin 5A hydrolase
MKSEIISFSPGGAELADRLADFLTARGDEAAAARGFGEEKVNYKTWTEEAFRRADAILFVGASGIAVRAIAPHVVSKLSDPAVVVLSEDGRFAIPLLSGHLGGANKLAKELAEAFGMTPVLTTGTDVRGLFAVDTWAKSQNLVIRNPGRIKLVSSKLLAGGEIRIQSDWPVAGAAPKGVSLVDSGPCEVRISAKSCEPGEFLLLTPRVLALGLGCRKGIEAEPVREAAEAVLAGTGCSRRALRGIFSIDLKKDEPALLALARDWYLPFQTASADELNAIPGTFSASDFVKKTTGTDCVCERAALFGCPGGTLICRKRAGNGVTAALAACEPKLSF